MKKTLPIFALSMASLLAACGGDESSSDYSTASNNQKVTITTNVGTSKSSSITGSQKSIQSDFSDITKIQIEATALDDSAVTFTTDLVERFGVYSASFELDKDRVYQFTANAFEGDSIPELGAEMWDTPYVGTEWTDNADNSYTLNSTGAWNELRVHLPTSGVQYLVTADVEFHSGSGLSFRDGTSINMLVEGENTFLAESNGNYFTFVRLGSSRSPHVTLSNISIKQHTPRFATLAYTGSTQQAATQDASINIALAHIDSGTNTTIPQIATILRPSAVASLASAEISITINGNAGELLQYQIIDESTNAPSGSITPVSGSVQLPNGSSRSTIVFNYTAPDATQFATLPHTSPYTFKITNSDGNSVSSNFSLDIVSDGINDGVHTTFNPTILGITGQRNESSVAWEVDADTAGDAAYIEYLWSFDTTSSTSMFSVADQNPGIMDAYDETVEGTINLQVTDTSINGGVTNYSYALIAGQFPDSVVDPADIKIAHTMTPATFSIDGSSLDLTAPIEVKRSSNNPGMRIINLDFAHPAKGDDVYLHNSIEYSWTLDTPSMPAEISYTQPTTDTLFSNASGSANLTAGAASLATTMTLPFVLEQQVVNLRLTIKGYSDANLTTLIETTEVVYPLILDPAWERLQNDHNDARCINAHNIATSTGAVFSSCSEPGTLLSYNPINGLIFSKSAILAGDNDLCLWGSGSSMYFCYVEDKDLTYSFQQWSYAFVTGNGWFDDKGRQMALVGSTLAGNGGASNVPGELNFNWVYVPPVHTANCGNLEGKTFVSANPNPSGALSPIIATNFPDPYFIAEFDYSTQSPTALKSLTFSAGQITVEHASPLTATLKNDVSIQSLGYLGTAYESEATITPGAIVANYSCNNNVVTFSAGTLAPMVTTNVGHGSSALMDILYAQGGYDYDDTALLIDISGQAAYDDANSTLLIADKVFTAAQ